MPELEYPVYIIHYTPLKERKKLLSEKLLAEGFKRVYWIEQFDREVIKEWPELTQPTNKLSRGVIAVNMAHAYACEEISATEEGFGLVLEDDALFEPGFKKNLQSSLAQLPADWDLLFIGDGCNFHIPFWRRRPGKKVYPKERTKTWWGGDGATRCVDSYFVSRKGAKNLLLARDMQRPFLRPIDWALNEAIREKSLNTYWLEPTLVTQGSQAGQFAGASYEVGAGSVPESEG